MYNSLHQQHNTYHNHRRQEYACTYTLARKCTHILNPSDIHIHSNTHHTQCTHTTLLIKMNYCQKKNTFSKSFVQKARDASLSNNVYCLFMSIVHCCFIKFNYDHHIQIYSVFFTSINVSRLFLDENALIF